MSCAVDKQRITFIAFPLGGKTALRLWLSLTPRVNKNKNCSVPGTDEHYVYGVSYASDKNIITFTSFPVPGTNNRLRL